MITEAMAGLTFDRGDWVLDIGCGDGFLTRAIAGLAPDGRVVGADASRRMVGTAAASSTGPTAAPSGPWFAVADARELPFARCFDAVVSFNALHWVPQQQRALSQIAAVLTRGGRVTVQVVCAGARPSLESVTMERSRSPRWAAWFEGFEPPFVHVDPAHYGELASSAGLTLDDLTVADREWDFGSRDAFAHWSAMGSTAWTDRLPVLQRESFIADQVCAYESVTGRAGLFRYMQMRAQLHLGRTDD